MKKNLRRIALLSLAIIATGRGIYATEESSGLLDGYMKFVFIGIAVITLVAILFLSYKLDKEEPLVDKEGSVSKKKLRTKGKNKYPHKKDNLYSNFSDSTEEDEEEYYKTDLEQDEFEEISEDSDEDNLYQEIDSLEDDYEESVEDDDLSNQINELDDENYEDYNEYEEEKENVDFDTSVLDDLEDYEDPYTNKISNNIEENEDFDFNFDTSVLDDLDDYEDTNNVKKLEEEFKPLSNTNMTPKSTKRFTSSSNNSGIGFRNNTTTTNSEIGFRTQEKKEESSIGFKRKKQTEEFGSEDFLSQMEENLRASKPTTTKTKKSATTSKDTKTATTSKTKKTTTSKTTSRKKKTE